MKDNIEIFEPIYTGDIYLDAQNIINETRKFAYNAVDITSKEQFFCT